MTPAPPLMLRALAYSRGPGTTPADGLARFDEVAEGLGAASFATAVHTQLWRRPDFRWSLSWSNAGHPPPLLIPAHGDPLFLDGTEEDLPLCVDLSLPRSTARHRRAPLPELLHGLQYLSDHRDDTAMIAFRAGSPDSPESP
ncbi:SpoIIE family protein phosphatase [Streptomyces sp. NPDC058659]|uniref:SpoIIE family protein phosphatase n=1 Tax=unclassified Streptomyces TaxID=2593676 RepID=UPI003666E16E